MNTPNNHKTLDRRRFARNTAISSLAAGALGTTAPGNALASAAMQSEGGLKVARMNTTQRVSTHFNPIWFIGTGSQWHSFPFIWLPLMFYDAEGQMQPWLAQSVDATPDATQFTFSLHQNAVWTDGTPITSEDVKFSYELFVHPDTIGLGSVGFTNLQGTTGLDAYLNGEAEGIDGIEIIDDYTVRFTLDSPNSMFLYESLAFILPKHVLGDTPISELGDHPYMDDPTVTSGPFRLANYEPQRIIELEAWPEYWGEKQPKIDRLVLHQVDGAAVMNMVEAGELDFAVYLGTNDLDRLEQMEGVTPLPTLSAGYATIYVNGRREYLQDPRVRQALLHAIDRSTLNELLHKGQGVEINSSIFAPEWALNPDLDPYPYDPERAMQLLSEAGWDSNQTLVYWTTEPSDDQAAFLQASFQAVGVKVEILTEAFAAVTDAFDSDSFDLASHTGGLLAIDPSFAESASGLTCGSNWSKWNGYCDPELTELMEAGTATTDQDERQQIYWQAAAIDNRDLPWLYLHRPPTIYAVNDRLTGLTPPISFRFANTSLLDWDVSE